MNSFGSNADLIETLIYYSSMYNTAPMYGRFWLQWPWKKENPM